ncbi:class II histocompatibility antigen, B-L beta chain-like isoform X4 [Emydura macquarii macquarii]|uniref:class II histocompatibility antigen, B-L beta chain-like isoform X3 n=1 Tax=Emydura macquarii macquarii TaxID=1129001 RepID=UPI003529EDAC
MGLARGAGQRRSQAGGPGTAQIGPCRAAMGPGRSLGAGSCWAGALLVTLTVLGTRLAHCTEPPEHFVYQAKFECHFTNGTEGFRFVYRHIYNRQQFVHFDSDLGLFVADSELGRIDVETWNKDPAVLAYRRAGAERFCRTNYEADEPYTIDRRVQPEVTVFPTKSGSQPHLLVCSVTGFYPGGIQIKWLKNGQEQTAGVVSTELLQNGDWTFQILVMLEMSPRRGDVYACQVQHVSLPEPLTVRWEAQSDTARSKMLTGVGGFVLGLIFLAPGLAIYLRNKKGRPLPQPAGLLS